MKAYIAGKITGDPSYKAKFDQAKQLLSRGGYKVITSSNLPQGMQNSDYMRICMAMIDVAEVVAFLPDWKDSSGARLEHCYCEYIGKKIIYIKAVPETMVNENPLDWVYQEVGKIKKRINSPNWDYQTGYMSALSVVEGLIAISKERCEG